ncbi:hypothetical protein EDB84DRAFT_1561409 [Lactarius hengduanensis]|nr:hypothetical protein EDB84DRAFT_1561409 [Lactarius hengduanensis]
MESGGTVQEESSPPEPYGPGIDANERTYSPGSAVLYRPSVRHPPTDRSACWAAWLWVYDDYVSSHLGGIGIAVCAFFLRFCVGIFTQVGRNRAEDAGSNWQRLMCLVDDYGPMAPLAGEYGGHGLLALFAPPSF